MNKALKCFIEFLSFYEIMLLGILLSSFLNYKNYMPVDERLSYEAIYLVSNIMIVVGYVYGKLRSELKDLKETIKNNG